MIKATIQDRGAAPPPPQDVTLVMDRGEAESLRFMLSHMSYWSNGPIGTMLGRLADALDTVVGWDVHPSPFTAEAGAPELKRGA